MSFRFCQFASIALLMMWEAAPARAEYAILANGFRLQVERHQTQGSSVRLFIAGGGYAEVRDSDILGYEKEEPILPPARPEAPALWQTAGLAQGLDPLLLKSMIAEESNFDPAAVSRKGAAGLMQLMPATAQALGLKDLLNASENVHGGALYLRALLERYRGDLARALAAYNAGPGAVDRYRGIPPYRETQSYVRRVITRFNREKTREISSGP